MESPLTVCEIAKNFISFGYYFQAIETLTEGLRDFPSSPDLLLGRAILNLRLNFFHRALQDADNLIKIAEESNTNITGEEAGNMLIIIKTKSLLGLGRYTEAYTFLEEIKKLSNYEISANANIIEIEYFSHIAKNCISQEEYGSFDILGMKRAADDNPRIRFESCARNYISPKICGKYIKSENINKGRGLVTVEKIEKDELIIASKALVILYYGEMASDVYKIPKNIRDELFQGFSEFEEYCEMVELGVSLAFLLSVETELQAELFRLYEGGGRSKENVELEIEENTHFIERIKKIVIHNGFAFTPPVKVKNGKRKEDEENFRHVGIWMEPSFLNNDCADDNVDIEILGDFVFIKAKKDINAGDEILISYRDSKVPYKERKENFATLGFICKCRLCLEQSTELIEINETN